MEPEKFYFTKLRQKWKDAAKQRRLNAAAARHALIRCCDDIFKEYGIEKAIVFGSIIEQRFEKQSDIDIYVSPLSNKHFWEFRRKLEDVIEMPIDLYSDKDEKAFVQKILSRGEVIYEV